MPRSRSRSPNPRDRYSGNRYRGAGGGGGPSNAGNVRRRNSRSRSRSPRDRDGRNDRTHRDRYQQRTERPAKRHSRSRSPSPKAFGNKIVEKKSEPTTNRIFDPSELQGKTEDEIEMLKAMGFASFDTTKGKHTAGSTNAYGVNIQQKRRYRQYMNRKGGFNRPLDPIA